MLVRSDDITVESRPNKSRFKRVFRIEWLGQTAASLFWIASVFAYGITPTGDGLQLLAATAWLVANVATLASNDKDED